MAKSFLAEKQLSKCFWFWAARKAFIRMAVSAPDPQFWDTANGMADLLADKSSRKATKASRRKVDTRRERNEKKSQQQQQQRQVHKEDRSLQGTSWMSARKPSFDRAWRYSVDCLLYTMCGHACECPGQSWKWSVISSWKDRRRLFLGKPRLVLHCWMTSWMLS